MSEFCMPHVENRKVACPELCPYFNKIWKVPCTHVPGLNKPRIYETMNFKRNDKKDITPEQVENFFNNNKPPQITYAGCIISKVSIQVYYYDNLCIGWVIRNVFGLNAVQYIQNFSFKEMEDNMGHEIYFEMTDPAKIQKLKDTWQDKLREHAGDYFDKNLSTKEIINHGTYTSFDFKLIDKGMPDFKEAIVTKLNQLGYDIEDENSDIYPEKSIRDLI